MKKSIFAVAVASALTLGAAQAETVLYGSVRFDYENKKNEQLSYNDKGDIVTAKNRVSNFNDLGSRIGLKGSEDLGNGNAVIYHLEWGFDGMGSNVEGEKGFGTRLAYMGFTGDWGTVAMGRQNNPFKETIVDDSIVDDFNGVGSAGTQRAMTMTLTGIDSYVFGDDDSTDLGNFDFSSSKFTRVGKALAYVSPDFSGFGFNAALIMDEDLNAAKHVDLWTINANYVYDMGANGSIYAKAGYIQGKTSKNDFFDENGNYYFGYDKANAKVWGVNLGYKQDAFGVTAAYAQGRLTPSDTVYGDYAYKHPKQKTKGWDIGASFSFGPNYFSTVRATYGESEFKQTENYEDGDSWTDKGKVKSWAVGFEQKLSQRTRTWIEYGEERLKVSGNDYYNSLPKRKDNKVSIGMRHDF